MRKWGILVSVFYALIVFVLLIPGAIFITGRHLSPPDFFEELASTFGDGLLWLFIIPVLAGQALLLFLSVDTSQKRLKPRAHIALSCAITALLLGLLTVAAVLCVGTAVNEKFLDTHFEEVTKLIGFWVLLWAIWGIFFYLYVRNTTEAITRAASWLLKGSVLELLIAVPCHVIVRRRGDCCAPAVTSFGIATGIAIMLLSFGPSVLFLYKKRLDSYTKP